jgi:hypothetical protein
MMEAGFFLSMMMKLGISWASGHDEVGFFVGMMKLGFLRT